MAEIIRPIKGKENLFEILEEIREDFTDENGEKSILYKFMRKGEIVERNNYKKDEEKPTEIIIKEFIGRNNSYGEALHKIYNVFKTLADKKQKSFVYAVWNEKPHREAPFRYLVKYF